MIAFFVYSVSVSNSSPWLTKFLTHCQSNNPWKTFLPFIANILDSRYLDILGQMIPLRNIILCAKSLQSCLTHCNSMDCSSPGSSLHGILQARILEWLPYPPPGDLPNPGIASVSHVYLHWQEGSLSLAPPRKHLRNIIRVFMN